MIENHTISHVDVTAGNLPKKLREKYTKHHRPNPPYFDRYEEYKDLLTYFPKTQHKTKTLKLFLLKKCNFDKTFDQRIELYKNCEQKHNLARNKLRLGEFKNNIKEQWNELIEKERDLKISFVTFQEFLKYSQDKREKLLEDIRQHKKTRKSREKGVELLSQENPRLRKIIENMHKDIERMSIYEEFLGRALTCQGNQFEKVDEIINHIEIIHEKKSLLAGEVNLTASFVSGWVWKMINLSKTADNEIQDLKMNVYNLERRYEDAKRKVKEMQNFRMFILGKLKQRSQEFMICKQSIYSIYTIMLKRLPQKAPLNKDDFMGQLEYMSRILAHLEMMGKQDKGFIRKK